MPAALTQRAVWPHFARPSTDVSSNFALSYTQAASALAALDADVAHQAEIIHAGGIPPLVALLKTGSAAAQAFAAQALANAAAYDSDEGQNAIVRAGAIPMLLILLSVGKAQTPAAHALAALARACCQSA